MQRRLIYCRRFETNYRSDFKEPIGNSETSVLNQPKVCKTQKTEEFISTSAEANDTVCTIFSADRYDRRTCYGVGPG
jgi:hypothetical protein